MLTHYLKKQFKLIALFLALTLPLAFLAPYKSYVMQWLIDAESPAEIPAALGMGALIFLSVFLLEWAGRNLFSRISTNVAASLRQDLLGSLLRRNLGGFAQETTGSYLSCLNADVRAIQSEILTPLYNICLYGGMLTFTLVMLFRISPSFFWVSVAMAVFPAGLPRLFAKLLTKSRSAFSQENASYTTTVKDILGGFETVRSFGAEGNLEKSHADAARRLSVAEFAYNKIINCNITTISFMGHVVFFLILAVGIALVLAGEITMGYMVTATNLINYTMSPVQVISQSISKIIATRGIRQKMGKLLAESDEKESGEVTAPSQGQLKLEDISFAYPGSDKQALQNCSWTFEAGKTYAIVGQSGSGKSTLAKLLTRMYGDFDGSITYGGIDIRRIPRGRYTDVIAMVPQKPFLFNGTIGQNIALFSDAWTDEEVFAAAGAAGLSDFISQLPEGIHTPILENNLSGGQAQRIGIARALLRKPQVLIADEPTSSLDKGLADDIEKMLLNYQGTSIIITHRESPDFFRQVDGVIHMEKGRIK